MRHGKSVYSCQKFPKNWKKINCSPGEANWCIKLCKRLECNKETINILWSLSWLLGKVQKIDFLTFNHVFWAFTKEISKIYDKIWNLREKMVRKLQITWKISNRSMNIVSGLLFCPWPKNGQKMAKNGCFWQFFEILSKMGYNSASDWDIKMPF